MTPEKTIKSQKATSERFLVWKSLNLCNLSAYFTSNALRYRHCAPSNCQVGITIWARYNGRGGSRLQGWVRVGVMCSPFVSWKPRLGDFREIGSRPEPRSQPARCLIFFIIPFRIFSRHSFGVWCVVSERVIWGVIVSFFRICFCDEGVVWFFPLKKSMCEMFYVKQYVIWCVWNTQRRSSFHYFINLYIAFAILEIYRKHP